MQITYKEHNPTPEEFNILTKSVNWGTRENKIVEEALKHTLYSLCVYDENKLIGYGRIIGDKTIFLYIQDIMVIPAYQGKKIGTGIMNKLIQKSKSRNKNILRSIKRKRKLLWKIWLYLKTKWRLRSRYDFIWCIKSTQKN